MKLATLCYVRRDGKTLMLLRNKKINDMHAGKWNGLGGKFEAGETPEDCAIREIYEESGLRVVAPQLCGVLTFPINQDQRHQYRSNDGDVNIDNNPNKKKSDFKGGEYVDYEEVK